MLNPEQLGFNLQLVADIYKTYQETAYSDECSVLRPHLGASLIGDGCPRKIWYTFRWAKVVRHGGRMLRLFQTGNLEEARFVKDLRLAGIVVHEFDKNNNYKQFGISFFGGHFAGSLDCCCVGFKDMPQEWHVGEFKTHNAKSFEKLMLNGVKETKFDHYSQMNTYMGGTGMRYAMYLAKNKDTDELYAERIAFDPVLFEAQKARAENIIFSDQIPGKISAKPESKHCTYCDFKEICHEGEEMLETCRSCMYSRPLPDGTWTCLSETSELNGVALTKIQQFKGCKHWEPLEGIV